MGYCFMRCEKIKTVTSFTGRFNHNFRIMDVPNADPSMRDFNDELVKLPEGETYYSVVQKKIKNAEGYQNSKPRKDAVKALEIVLEYNPRTAGEDFDEEAWKRENVRWLRDTFGEDNVISAVCHGDEGAGAYYGSTHIHAVVVPLRDGRLNAKYYTGGNKKMSDLQTSYASYMANVGLERGLQGSHARHMDVKRFYAAEEKIIKDELPMPEENEKIHEYRERVNEIYVDANLKHFHETLKLKQKVNEAKTLDINDKIELEKLRKAKKTADKNEKQAQRFTEILSGLKHGYFQTPEENEAFKAQMKAISDWEKERVRNKKVDR